MTLQIAAGKLAGALALTAAGLTVASLIGSLSAHLAPHANGLWREAQESFIRLFYLDSEANIPTWFASSMLLGCAALLGLIALAKNREGDSFARHWSALAVIFLGLSLDEAALLHEMAIKPLRPLFDSSGFLHYTWVVPGALVVCLLAVAYLRFLLHLPWKTRILAAISGALYVGGAIGAEAVTGKHAAQFGEGNLAYAMLATAEEVMEMLGVVTFMYALLEYAGRELGEVTLSLGTTKRRSAPGATGAER
ncbi:MAG: hypothetical protein ACE147_11680 [Candidatus Methylomirabilales bacterium]